MPWVYELTLSQYRDAADIETDWMAVANELVAHSNGGTTVGFRPWGALAVVVSTPREPNYSDMEQYGYVDSVEESFEIASDEVAHLRENGAGSHTLP